MNKKGYISIFLLCGFIGASLLAGALIDLMRIKAAESSMEKALYSSARNLLGGYDKDIFQKYELLGLKSTSKDLEKELMADMENNLISTDPNILNLQMEWGTVEPLSYLNENNVLEKQILEGVKYTAPVDAFKALEEIMNIERYWNLFMTGKMGTGEEKEELLKEVKENNKVVKEKKELISKNDRKIEQARNAGDMDTVGRLEKENEGYKKEIKGLYDENYLDVRKIEAELENGEGRETKEKEAAEKEIPNVIVGTELLRKLSEGEKIKEKALQKAETKDPTVNLKKEAGITSSVTEHEGELKKTDTFLKNIKEIMGKSRDAMYLNEYLIGHLSNLNKPIGDRIFRDTETEYVITGLKKPQPLIFSELYGMRFALDSAGYFLFGEPSIAEPSLRVVYALLMASWQAALDVYTLLGEETRVPIINIIPEETNKLKDIKVSYEDHLRILMYGTEKGKKLERLSFLVTQNEQVTTGLEIKVTASLDLFFPHIFFKGAAPFGSRIQGNKCYIEKKLIFQY